MSKQKIVLKTMNHSTINMILKNKDRIMERVKFAVPMTSTITLKKHGKVMEEVKKFSMYACRVSSSIKSLSA